MRRVLALLITVLLLIPFPVGASNKPGDVFKVHGRLCRYNGAWPFRIWIVGTNRLLGVNETEEEHSEMPDSLSSILIWESPRCFDQALYADFLVQAVAPYREGEMQLVRILDATNIVFTENDKILLMKDKL